MDQSSKSSGPMWNDYLDDLPNGNSNPNSQSNWLADLLPSHWSPSTRRWVPIAAGATMAAIGLSRKSLFGMALAATGGALAYYGSRIEQAPQDFEATASVLLNCSTDEAYRRYRNFEDFPTFMHHLDSVTKMSEGRYRWKVRGPLDMPIEWEAKITDERKGEFIAWQSLPDSAIEMEGSVRFQTAPANRGAFLTSVTRFTNPAGRLGRAVAKLFGKDPSFLMQQDLRRFKALIEAGEIATTEGQSAGPRSGKAPLLRNLDPDKPKRREPQPSETANPSWRTA
jgi:uncharacterized membrane protein